MKTKNLNRSTALICSAVMFAGVTGRIPEISATAALNDTAPIENESIKFPAGWLLWHNYSDYSALDSTLYLRTPDGITKEITGDFVHAMNGSFGTSPEQITFMAIDSKADEWDIYIVENGNTVNLTQNSGFRNEDPKWSPDRKSVV